MHYSTTNVYINNTTYYNRFNNNNNLNPSYKPRPVPYNNNPNSVYARSMGNSPAAKQGVVYCHLRAMCRITTIGRARPLTKESSRPATMRM